MEGRGGEAIALLDAAPEPPEYETHILKAAEIYSSVDPARAVPLLHAFLTECPDSALAHLAMAEAAGKMGDTVGATQYYQCALDINKAYRDPDFEAKYGIELENAPPAFTAKTQTVPLPIPGMLADSQDVTERIEVRSPAPDVESTPESDPSGPTDSAHPQHKPAEELQKEQKPDETPASSKKSNAPKRPRANDNRGGWVLTSLVAVGVFFLCWMLLFLVVKSMMIPS